MDRNTWTKTLKAFKALTAKSMGLARSLSEAAIAHFEAHGDLVYCQELYDVMPKNYVRRVAFVKWLAKYAPVILIENKLLKDKGPEAVPFDLKGANAKPFWEAIPNTEQVTFVFDDVVKALKATAHKFRKDRYNPSDAKAMAAVNAADEAIAVVETIMAEYKEVPAEEAPAEEGNTDEAIVEEDQAIAA